MNETKLYYMLGLIYTYKCNAECKMCIFSCSPKREEKMSLEDAKKLVKDAKNAGIKLIGISGGEPFIYFDEIVELSNYVREQGLALTLTTNCFWATTYDVAVEKLSLLKANGAAHIKISADDFHAEFVPYENIINVLRAGRTVNVRVVLGCTVTKNSSRLKGLLQHLENEVFGNILTEVSCYPIGRAENMNQDDFIYTNDINNFCREQGMLSVTPTGDVYPCGNICSFVPSRRVGSVYEESLKDLINKAESNIHTDHIARNGIKPYFDYIKENNVPVEIDNRYTDTCHACYDLFRKKDNIKYLDEIASKLDN